MPTIYRDIRDFDRRAVRVSTEVVGRVRPADLARPTPCGHWNLAELLAHMTAQHRGFAAASAGRGADGEVWRPVRSPSDPVREHRAAADEVLAAFAAEGVLEQPFALPELSPAEFPAIQAIGFHFIDYVVHGWDVARALGENYVLDGDLAPLALRIAEQVPNGAERSRPSAAFAPALPLESGSSALERILLLLGRTPSWNRDLQVPAPESP